MSAPLLALVAALTTTALAHVAYKQYSLDRNRLYLLVTVGLFGVTPALTYLAVKAFGIGLVYIATSMTYVIVAIAGRVVFGERLTRRTIVAMLLIVSGVLLYGSGLL